MPLPSRRFGCRKPARPPRAPTTRQMRLRTAFPARLAQAGAGSTLTGRHILVCQMVTRFVSLRHFSVTKSVTLGARLCMIARINYRDMRNIFILWQL